MTARPVRKCPKCGEKVKRLISSGAGILFKGSGFYQTDYRSASYREKANQEKKSTSPETSDKKSGASAQDKKVQSDAASSHKSSAVNPAQSKSKDGKKD